MREQGLMLTPKEGARLVDVSEQRDDRFVIWLVNRMLAPSDAIPKPEKSRIPLTWTVAVPMTQAVGENE